MQTMIDTANDDLPHAAYAFRLTPAEWRSVLEDAAFFRDPGNSIRPRRLMGVPVQIVPDHRQPAGW